MLYIAEKPSLARAIAEELGSTSKSNGFIKAGNDIVTWCFGHLFEQKNPEDYDIALKKWERSVLPIIPKHWELKPRKDCMAQIKIIGTLLKNADHVVNAGDPDREGQLLVDEVLEHFKFSGKVSRIWLASLDSKSINKALNNLTDNKEHAPLRDAARARSQADWLVGLNATRAMTLLGRDAGLDGVLSLGRVQTPTLNLVVMRDRDIKAFTPHDFYVTQASFTHVAGTFLCNIILSEDHAGLDEQGRLIDKNTAESIVKNIVGEKGIILSSIKENKQKAPPLPHSLSSLQKAASAQLGMTAQKVLDTAQKLYENKLTTYPRSDCRYLPVEQFDAAKSILSVLDNVPGLEMFVNADASIKSGAWNTKKITAHHGIIPTGEMPDNLTNNEYNLYIMIATAYCQQFYLPMKYEAQKIVVKVEDLICEAHGRRLIDAGWTITGSQEQDKDQESNSADTSLPDVQEGDAVTCEKAVYLNKKTTPPAKWTEGTLIDAMANIHRFVTDSGAKSILKGNEGIGTEATRAGILESLKKREYLKASGKALVATSLAGQVIDLAPHALKDAVTTAQWESKLEDIAQGKYSLADFMLEQTNNLPEILAPILSPNEATLLKLKSSVTQYPCPKCNKPLRRCKGTKGFFWGCSAYPDCQTILQDVKGKPVQRDAGKESAFTCPECGEKLTLFKRKSKKTGKLFHVFNCSGYPDCKFSAFAKNGKPDFEGK